ncbi:MAG: hypothetical protein H6705_01880 [Myxococcales bacterium]|nr:hypothetical protein [Myxococcales bacterium]
MDMLRAVLAALPQRRAYYPGATEKYAMFLDAHPQAQPVGPRAPRACCRGRSSPTSTRRDGDAVAFREEAWCSIVSQTALPAADAAEFLKPAPSTSATRRCGARSTPR